MWKEGVGWEQKAHLLTSSTIWPVPLWREWSREGIYVSRLLLPLLLRMWKR